MTSPAAPSADRRLPTLGQAALLYALIVALQLLPGIVLAALGIDSTLILDEPVLLIVNQLLLMFLPIFLLTRLFRWDLRRTYRWRGVSLPIVLLSIVASLTFVPLAQEIESALEYFLPVPQFIEELFRLLLTAHSRLDLALTLVDAAVIPAIVEEILFRGVLLWALLRRTTPARAVLISSFLFAFIHLNPWQFVGAFILGSIYGAMVVWSGSLWPAVAAHAVNNAAFILLANTANLEETPGELLPRLGLVALSTLLFVFSLVRIRARRQLPDFPIAGPAPGGAPGGAPSGSESAFPEGPGAL